MKERKTVTIGELMNLNWNRLADLTSPRAKNMPGRDREIDLRIRLQNLFSCTDNIDELRKGILLTAQTLDVYVDITDERLEELF